MSEQDENGDPQYAGDASVAFEAKYASIVDSTLEAVDFAAAGPQHHTGSGWIVRVTPIRTRHGDIEPVYLIRLYWLDGAHVDAEPPRYILLGETEITTVFTIADDGEKAVDPK